MVKIKNKTTNKTASKITAICLVLLIVALLAVPIFAKPDTTRPTKQVQNLQQANGANGKLKHKIKMGNLLAEGDQDNKNSMRLEKVENRMKMHIPKGKEIKGQARIKIKDLSGEEIAELIADFDELTDSEKQRIEKGEASVRSIRSLRLVSKEKEVKGSDSKGNKHRMKAHVDVGLNSINDDSSLDITTNNELDEVVELRFNEIAKKNRLGLKNRGGVMKVDKISLKNGKEVKDAKITFKVEPEWVGQENVNNVKVFRMDDGGYTEVLPTEFAGIDEDGLFVFEGQSDNGLSTFAVFMTESISQADEASFDWGALKNLLLPVLILVTLGAAFAGSMMKKEH